MRWTLLEHTARARVVSDRAAKLPLDLAGLRQAVVRIQSRQRLDRFGQDGKRLGGDTKEVCEYLVLQRRLMNGKESPWLVWGTTNETTVDKLKDDERRWRGEL